MYGITCSKTTVRNRVLYYYDSYFYYKDWAIVVPMANEQTDFECFINVISFVTNELNTGKVYFIVDSVSKGCTLELCKEVTAKDPLYVTVWAPKNRRDVVDDYMKDLRVAYESGHELIIEMSAGLLQALPMFLRV